MAAGSISTDAKHHHEEGLAKDHEIPAQRPVVNVIRIELNHPFMVQFTPAADLPRTRHPRQNREATLVAFRIQGQEQFAVANRKGTRSHQAHLALEDIQQLGKLVQAVATQERAQSRDADRCEA